MTRLLAHLFTAFMTITLYMTTKGEDGRDAFIATLIVTVFWVASALLDEEVPK